MSTQSVSLKPGDHFPPPKKGEWTRHFGWIDFFETFWKLIYRTALNASLSRRRAGEVVRDTVIGIARSAPGHRFDPRHGPFKNWLLSVTLAEISRSPGYHGKRIVCFPQDGREAFPAPRRTGLTGRRARGRVAVRRMAPRRLNDGREAVPEFLSTHLLVAEERWDQVWEKNSIDVALRTIRRRVEPESFQVFALCVIKNWSLFRVARCFKKPVSRLYGIPGRIQAALEAELRRMRGEFLPENRFSERSTPASGFSKTSIFSRWTPAMRGRVCDSTFPIEELHFGTPQETLEIQRDLLRRIMAVLAPSRTRFRFPEATLLTGAT